MRIRGSLTVSSVFAILTITATALPKTRFTTTALISTALAPTTATPTVTSELLSHRYNGRQASPHTSGSTPTTPTTEYTCSESSKEDCDCAEVHSSINGLPILTSRELTAITTPSSTTSPVVAPAYLYSTSTSSKKSTPVSPSQSEQPQIQLTPQFQYYGMPATTLVQQPGQAAAGAGPQIIDAPLPTNQWPAGGPAPPGGADIPSIITPMAPAPTSGGSSKQDIEALISRGGQPWYQVTYYECVTWPSKYVHCGWHTPLRIGRNPDPEGETFVYGAAVRTNGRIGLVLGTVLGVLMITL